MSVLAGLVCFFGFAYKMPIHHKLYKEILYSMGLGTVMSYSYPYYKYQ